MKKILWITNLVPHYTKDMFQSLACVLPQHGMEFYMLSGNNHRACGRVGIKEKVIRNEEKFNTVEIHLGTYVLYYQLGVMEKVRDIMPDVVVTPSQVGGITSWKLMRLRKSLGFRMVAWQCGFETHPGFVKDQILKRYVRGFDYHFAYHSNAKKYALRYGAAESRTVVMHNTINEQKIPLMAKSAARDRIRTLHPTVGDRRILLYVGAVMEEKRLDTVVRALDMMRRADLVFVVVGDGPHMAALKKIYGERDDIVWAGRVIEGVAVYFAAADIFIMPGTGGLALNEAMAHSLPIISGYADGSADDLIIDGENGLRLKTGEAGEIAETISILSDDGNLRAGMGRLSREILIRNYSYESFIERICGTLRQAALGTGVNSSWQ